MKRIVLLGMLLGLLTGMAVAQRGRGVSPTARPDVNLGAARSTGVSPVAGSSRTIGNQGVSPTVAPIKDPTIGRSATAAQGTNQNVSPTAAPIRDPLAGPSATAGSSTTVDRNVSPTVDPPIRDPK